MNQKVNFLGRQLAPSLYYQVKPDVILKDVCKNAEISPSVFLDATTLQQIGNCFTEEKSIQLNHLMKST